MSDHQNTTDTGGAAYPQPHAHIEQLNATLLGGSGMTLLDYFAGQALSGVLANPSVRKLDESISGEDAVAEAAYVAAAAMVAEKRRRESHP